jgi:TolB-like protein
MEPRSRNAADSLLAEGLTLEIINTLSGVARLDVKSRFFSRRIAADVDPVRSARSFGVDYTPPTWPSGAGWGWSASRHIQESP